MTDIQVQQQIEENINLKKLVKRFNVVIVIIILAPAILFGLVRYWIDQQVPAVSSVEIANLQMRSPALLCPGEPLIVSYTLHTKGLGVLVRDQTLRDISPPRTIVYSEFRRFIVDGDLDQELTETWLVPATYFNYSSGSVQSLLPGEYRYYLSISSPSRSTAIAIGFVQFRVRDKCL